MDDYADILILGQAVESVLKNEGINNFIEVSKRKIEFKYLTEESIDILSKIFKPYIYEHVIQGINVLVTEYLTNSNIKRPKNIETPKDDRDNKDLTKKHSKFFSEEGYGNNDSKKLEDDNDINELGDGNDSNDNNFEYTKEKPKKKEGRERPDQGKAKFDDLDNW